MDEEGQDGPFTVWQMFNAPTLVLFNNLENAADGLERLLNSILKLSGVSEVLVPRLGSTKYPDVYYSAFNTWLIGRLFYVWSVKELNRIHILSKDAQLKILNILSMNDASFYDKLHSEYFSILNKLIQSYNDAANNQPVDICLEHFSPDKVVISNVELKLDPIYVQVKDLRTCKSMMDLTLQLLSQSITFEAISIDRYKNDYEKVFQQVLYVLDNFGADMKLASLRFFADLFANYEQMAISKFHRVFPDIFKELLKSFEAIVKSMHVFYEKGEVDKLDLESFKNVSLALIKFVENNLEQEYTETLTTVCTVILRTKSNDIFGKELKLYCLSLSSKIELAEDLMEMKRCDGSEVNMLVECYCNKIILYIQSTIENNQPVNLTDNWFYNQLITVFDELRKHDCINAEKVLYEYSLLKCRAVLKILFTAYVQGMKMNKREADVAHYSSLFIKNIAHRIWNLQLRNINRSGGEILLFNIQYIMLNLIVDTMVLVDASTLAIEEINELLRLICLKSTPGFPTLSSNRDQKTSALILKQLLIAIAILKRNRINEAWGKFIYVLFNELIKNKTEFMYSEVISMSGLLLINKVLSPSKLIGDILMPAFLIKNHAIQTLLTKELPAVSCIALGTYHVVLGTAEETEGHTIFNNGTINVSIICSNCHRTSDPQNKRLILHSECQNAIENQSTTLGLRNLFGKFLNANQYSDLKNTSYWDLVGRLCNHYYVFNCGVPNDLLCEENCHHILQALIRMLGNQLEDKELNTHRENALNLCVNLLVKSTQSCLEDNSYNRQTQTLNNIKEFGIHGNEKVILPVTKLLVYFIMHPQCSLGPKAVLYLREICEVHGYTPNQVYHRYKKDYCKLFVECSLYSGKEFAVSLLKVVRAFGFVGYRDFISKDVHHFLPYLMPYSVIVKQVPAMIEEIASLVQCSVSDFLIERFPHVYVHVYLNETKEVAQKCNATIEKLTKTSTLSLIKKHFRVILTEFLLQYCCNPDKVLNACRYLACHDPDVSTPDGSMSMSTIQIADFLNPKFLGVLAYFDHKLVNAKVALSVKRKALKSFPDIMQLMGEKYLTPLRFKVLATLRSALPLAKEFPKILAEAWGAFIHNIDSMSLGPLLTNLAVSLLQQLEYAPQEINKIFQYLVINNENLLSSHISDLFFLEDTNLSEKIKMVVKRHVKRTQPEAFLDKVKWYLHHLDQDIPRIKAYAFSQLDKLLKKNRTEIHKAIFGGKNIDPAIVELIDALLQGCKHPDSNVSAASGACLGQLGAIEAGHLPRQYVQPDRSPFAFSIGDNCFAATALMELARAFQYEKDTMNMDSYALTIQEILKIYDISPTGSKKDVWDSFPEHMHQIMFPLLSSRYTLAYPSQPKKVHPLFGTAFATTFLEWAHNWAGQLIPLIESENVRELLRTVHPSMRRDVRTLFLFLPYVLLHAVMSKNNTQYIQEEILAVIGSENSRTESGISERNRYKMLRDVRLTPNINTVQSEEGNQSKCSKTIYTLLDFLNRWLLEWCNSKPRPLENENYKAISVFMEKFDKLLIARGNFACGELERALQYLELYMAEKKDNLQEQLPLLAEIYALLDEPDSVAGILSIKRSEPSLNELILTQVVTGRLQDAALCYERLAQEGQLDRHSLRGMVDCYLGLDQPFTAYRLLSEHEAEDSATELAAEPLWRLGRFQQLDQLINKPLPSSRENWGIIMGRILLSYRSQDTDAFQLSCKTATARLLAQMDGETKGESALRSGYQSVLGLHVITEAGHVGEVLRRFTCRLYDAQTEHICINEVRKNLFASNNKLVTSLPPTSAALYKHALRAAYQAGHIWGNALETDVSIPCPSSWGWTKAQEIWTPDWSAVAAMRSQLNLLDCCGCKSGCDTMRCGCRRVSLQYTTQCKSCKGGCTNQKLKNLNDGDRQANDVLNKLLDEWRRRLSVVQSDVRTVEPLLRLRRILLQQTKELLEPTHSTTAGIFKACIGDLWLQSAKHARKAGIFQQSYMYILNAEEYRPEELFIEKSKMYWARGQHEHAFTTLRRGLEDAYPQLDKLTNEQRKICAKAKLLIAKYNDETTNVDVDVNIGYYKEAVDVFKQWEKSLVCLGAYYEKVSSGENTGSSGTHWSRKLYALNSYGKALQYGHKYLYQSMPRMLSIWLDVEVTSSDTSIHSVLAQMTEVIKTYSERLPLYLYLTAFSQIVSRICHPVKEVYLQLKAIIVKLIMAYPQHTLWMMMSVIKSAYPQRIKRCTDVFADPRLKEPHMLKLVNDFTQLAEKLIELCNKPIMGSGSTTTVSALVRTLPRLLASENFSHIMMPFQEFCKIVLPSKAARQERIDFNIPASPPVYLAGIEENITILPSLQKPRKVTLKGSDGKAYIIMLKPRDDLRKDYRLMEFNVVVNRFLQDAPETRRRRLYIRTYSVLPLNEECGVIEWVPNLVGLRPILLHIYKQKGIHTSNRELKEMMCAKNDPFDKKRRMYEEKLLPRHPPVFQEWFRRVFSDPYGWYQARSAYIRTTAVMSMVGYILGLGDRHGENISFDSTNGDSVHVDFNCLFNKGESFEWPERVPFRLTHNMEAAMGPLKHEGMFRKSCEAVMRALRAQTAALMSVIGPFVYDPLVSWGRARPMDCGERTNEQALQHLIHIRQRLNGLVKTKNMQLSLSLSPEGQVEHLIVEATSIVNLCQMYIGWGPFL